MKSEMEQIVAGCRRRESKTQKFVYERYAPQLLGICMRYTHSADEARDLLHDSFIKIFEKITTLDKADNLESWMRQIVINTSINYVTRHHTLLVEDMSQVTEEFGDTTDPFDTDPYETALVMQAIQQLPDLYRMVFNMREVEEMEFADIAQQLNMKESSTRCALTRARQMLRSQLSKSL